MAQSRSVEPETKQAQPLPGSDDATSTDDHKPTHAENSPAVTEQADEVDVLPLLEGARQPTFWDDLRDVLPPWADEILAIALLIFGVLSFLSLFDTSGAAVAVAWANILRNLFGDGSLLVAAGIFIFGVIILLPKVGITIALPPYRVFALEVAFLSILALLHVLSGSDDLRTLARAGGGGGLLGWGLSALPHWLLGTTATLLIFGLALGLSFAVVAGLRRSQVIGFFKSLGQRLLVYSETLSGAMNRVTLPDKPASAETVVAVATHRNPLMRIVPDMDNLPPSLRRALLSSGDNKEDEIDISSHPLFKAKDELKIDFNLIGEVTKKKTEDGQAIVRRPDGREKRYFNVSKMKEEKKVGRRDKYLPSMDLLNEEEMSLPDEQEINHNVVLIENTLLEFDIDIDVIDVQVGPTVTRYAVQPYSRKADGSEERVRLGKIASYHNDLSLALSAKRLRLEIPVPGTNFMGIEVPNRSPSIVTLRSILESKNYYDKSQKENAPLLVPLGRDVSGKPLAINIAKMPHLLIAGTTGSGKSVAIAAIACSILMTAHPDTVKMVMLDPKMVELSRFNGIPHLLGPVETDTERIVGVLKWCTREMDRRYKVLEEHAVRNIDNYNEKFGSRRRGRDYMPYILIMIDEIGDLMMSQPEETERAITRLAQMARAVGMHLVIATQRPSVDVITGLIKANFPGRIAFSVASGVDSRVILDTTGAEYLMGRGDMLYLASDAGGPARVQGCFVSDEETRKIVEHWRGWNNEEIKAGNRERIRTGPWARGLTRREFLAETDPMLEEAIEFVVSTQEASASLIQRHLGLGYPRAARIMDMLEELGIVGDAVGGGRARRVLIPRGEDPFKGIIEKQLKEKMRQEKKDSGYWDN